METQNIANLLNDTDNESSKFATRKLCVINDQNNNMAKEMKIIEALNLRQRLSNQMFVIIQMHIFL